MTQNGNNRMIGRMFSYRVLRGYDKLSSPRPLSRRIWVKGNHINPVPKNANLQMFYKLVYVS